MHKGEHNEEQDLEAC